MMVILGNPLIEAHLTSIYIIYMYFYHSLGENKRRMSLLFAAVVLVYIEKFLL